MLEIGAALELIGQTINSLLEPAGAIGRAGQEFIVSSSDALIALSLFSHSLSACVSPILLAQPPYYTLWLKWLIVALFCTERKARPDDRSTCWG
jgi:hypothetical protein